MRGHLFFTFGRLNSIWMRWALSSHGSDTQDPMSVCLKVISLHILKSKPDVSYVKFKWNPILVIIIGYLTHNRDPLVLSEACCLCHISIAFVPSVSYPSLICIKCGYTPVIIMLYPWAKSVSHPHVNVAEIQDVTRKDSNLVVSVLDPCMCKRSITYTK